MTCVLILINPRFGTKLMVSYVVLYKKKTLLSKLDQWTLFHLFVNGVEPSARFVKYYVSSEDIVVSLGEA